MSSRYARYSSIIFMLDQSIEGIETSRSSRSNSRCYHREVCKGATPCRPRWRMMDARSSYCGRYDGARHCSVFTPLTSSFRWVYSSPTHHYPKRFSPILRFGTQRLWGAVGYAVTSLIGGILCSSRGGSFGAVMVVFVAAMLGTMAASTGIAVGRGHKKKNDCSPE